MEKLEQARDILERAIEEHQPAAIIGLFSGGHDSYTVTHFAASVLGSRLTKVCHIDTGIGIPETQQFVVDRCEAHQWPLEIYRAIENVNAKGEPDPQVYDDFVKRLGFPGPHGHGMMYFRLKDRQINRICREYPKQKVMFISGCRKEESVRRMGNTEEIQLRDKYRVWAAPFTYMTGSDCSQYMRENNLPRNPVKDRLCMSGECLCGAFAKPGELREIKYWYPEVGERIEKLEEEVRAAGFPWGWEEGPPKWWSDRKASERAGLQDMFEDEFQDAVEMLCTSCHAKFNSLAESGGANGLREG